MISQKAIQAAIKKQWDPKVASISRAGEPCAYNDSHFAVLYFQKSWGEITDKRLSYSRSISRYFFWEDDVEAPNDIYYYLPAKKMWGLEFANIALGGFGWHIYKGGMQRVLEARRQPIYKDYTVHGVEIKSAGYGELEEVAGGITSVKKIITALEDLRPEIKNDR